MVAEQRIFNGFPQQPDDSIQKASTWRSLMYPIFFLPVVKDSGKGITQEKSVDAKSCGLMCIREGMRYRGWGVGTGSTLRKGTIVKVPFPLVEGS